MINPIKTIDQKNYNDQQNIRLNHNQTPSVEDNGVDSSAVPHTYVERKDKVELNYDIDRYVRILKNMVIPPEDRFDASILLELELNGEITAQEVREMITLVEHRETKRKSSPKNTPQVNQEPADADSRGKEA